MNQFFQNIVSNIGINDVLDILIVAFLFYKLLGFIRETRAEQLAKGLLILVIVALLASWLHLYTLQWILSNLVNVGLIAIVIIFQPELRRMLERFGSSFFSNRTSSTPELETAIAQCVLACEDMSASRTGALIIFERNINLNDIINTGTMVNSDVNAELLKNIFFNKAPLHDGAVIIRDGRIAAAGCVLPLTKSTNLSKDLGMRHRAGIGLSEQSDALVVIVSEETGAISVAMDGMLKRHLSGEELKKVLTDNLTSLDKQEDAPGILNTIRTFFKGFEHEDESKTE